MKREIQFNIILDLFIYNELELQILFETYKTLKNNAPSYASVLFHAH